MEISGGEAFNFTSESGPRESRRKAVERAMQITITVSGPFKSGKTAVAAIITARLKPLGLLVDVDDEDGDLRKFEHVPDAESALRTLNAHVRIREVANGLADEEKEKTTI